MSTDLQRTGTTALVRPSFIKEGDTRGTENITRNDIKPPALKLAQAMSPEVKRSEPEFVKDLREGELFNSITKEIYGEGPVHLVFINFLGTRKVVLDGNVPEGDPRTDFTFTVVGDKQVRVKPKATKFKDFLVQLYIDGRDGQLMTLSLKSTQLKKAVNLTTIFSGSKLPTFAHLIEAQAVPEHKGANAWYGWKLTPVGYVSEAQFEDASKIYDDFLGKVIEVAEVEPDDALSTAGRQEELDDKDIPF